MLRLPQYKLPTTPWHVIILILRVCALLNTFHPQYKRSSSSVITPANEFMQMRSYPPPELSHPRPLDFHHHTLPPAVSSHQQPSVIPVENAPVPPPNRWSEYSGGVGLSYPSHQPPGNLDSGTNLVYPSFQRFPSTLPGSIDLGPLSDVGFTKIIYQTPLQPICIYL